MSSVLVYALHYEGQINKNSLGAVSEGARLAQELGTECHAIVVGAKKKPLESVGAADAGIDAGRVGYDNARAHCTEFLDPPEKAAGQIIEDEDTNETVEKIVAWLDERKLLA